METFDLLYRLFASRRRWFTVLAIVLLCGLLALPVGYALAELGLLATGAALVALGVGLWMLRNIEVAYWAVIGVACLLPFASFPFDIGVTPTFLDTALGALYIVWLFQIATRQQSEFVATGLGAPIVIFATLAIGSFIQGLSHASLTGYDLRHFAELLLSIVLFFLVVNTVRDETRLRHLAQALLICASLAATLGVGLYLVATFITPDWTIRALSTLGRLGYPTGPGVLRYIQDDPELPMRATSTSVDPNVLGSLLNMSLAMAVPQLFTSHPLLRRRYLVPMITVIALCLGLTFSRGSLIGVVAALAIVATLRYRQLWLLLMGAAVLLVLLPPAQGYVEHFIAGLQGEDLATQMRMGEYKDALILIGRYPWLGVGFSGSPDIDTYIGVSNVYLLIAEQMGLLGLGCFVIIIVIFLARFVRYRRLAQGVPTLESLWWGLHAGVWGLLVGGIFDHYFFNLDFHHSVTLFWLMVGLATAATEAIRQQVRASPGQSTDGHTARGHF